MEVLVPLVDVSPVRDEPDQTSEVPLGQPPDGHHEVLMAITFIGEDTPTIGITAQEFVGVPPHPPRAHPSTVLEVDVDLDSRTFYESVDPGVPSRNDSEGDTGNNFNMDHNARPTYVDDLNDPNTDLGHQWPGLSSSLCATIIVFFLLSGSGSRKAAGYYSAVGNQKA